MHAGNSLWFPWIPLCVLFVLPFFDRRRPLRLLHFDLVVLATMGLWPLHDFMQGGISSTGATVVTVVGLAYLFGRLLTLGFAHEHSRAPLMPVVPITWLAIGLALLVGLRLGYLVVDRALVI